MTRTAVVLFNLGGPDNEKAIKPFLYNFFMDRNIIRLPLPARWLVAKYISEKRSKAEAKASYAGLGYRSPLRENTEAQANALGQELGEDFKVFVSMRYWHPMAEETVRQVADFKPDHVVLLPLYPQFSTTTTRSSFQTWERAAAAARLDVPMSRVCCYPFGQGFIKASAENITAAYNKALDETAQKHSSPPRVLFSAHGLPEDIIKAGDPYQWQCEQSAKAIIREMSIPMLDWQLCYQSRIGPKRWIGPATEEAIEQAAKDGVPIVIYPHAFVSEHVETLVEIEIEYRELAEKTGVPYFGRVPTVGTHNAFIRDLADIVRSRIRDEGTCSHLGKRLCPEQFNDCCMNFAAVPKAA